MRDERFLIKVVELYYQNGLSKSEIGKRLHVSRTTVARTLSEALNEGYVQIQIHYPEGCDPSLEAQLEEKFHLQEAVIAHRREDLPMGEQIGMLAADFILRMLHSDMVIALSRGTTLKHMVECLRQEIRLRFLKAERVEVMPIMAASNLPVSVRTDQRLAYTNYLLEEFARIIHAESFQLLAPQCVHSPQTRQMLLQEPSVREVFDMAQRAELAILGIGAVTADSALVKSGALSAEQIKHLKDKGSAGELLSHFLDKDGNIVDPELEERMMCLSLEDLKRIPVRLGAAYGAEKHKAILSVLRGGYINVLITDADTARVLLDA